MSLNDIFNRNYLILAVVKSLLKKPNCKIIGKILSETLIKILNSALRALDVDLPWNRKGH